MSIRVTIRGKLGVFLIILGILGIADFAMLFLVTGILNLGYVLPALIGIAFTIYGIYNIRNKNRPFRLDTLPKKLAAGLLAIWLLSFIAIEGLILSAAWTRDEAGVDYLVVLGAGLRGGRPTAVLLARLEKAADYLDENPGLKVVVSGGRGPGETISEAEAMKKWLTDKGISGDRILTESGSTSTMENFTYTRALLRGIDKRQRLRIMIITNDFHMLRAKMLAARAGFVPYGISAQTYIYVLPNCYGREYFALIKSFFLDR